MAKKFVSIMMTSVAADHQSMTDTVIQSNDRNLEGLESAFIGHDDGSLDIDKLSFHLGTNRLRSKHLCKSNDPKHQKQVIVFEQGTWTKKQMWQHCILRNKRVLERFYHMHRNARKRVPRIKVFMRLGLSSTRVYCEDLSFMTRRKEEGRYRERDARQCRRGPDRGQKWESHVLDLDAINKAEPIVFKKCDRVKERRFTSFEGKKCHQYWLGATSGLCRYGMPDWWTHSNHWVLGRKNDLGQSIAKSCCECSTRQDGQNQELSLKLSYARESLENWVELYLPYVDSPCVEPMNEGTGSDNITMWYWTMTGCEEFTYKGQGGNRNKFASWEECSTACHNVPVDSTAFRNMGYDTEQKTVILDQ